MNLFIVFIFIVIPRYINVFSISAYMMIRLYALYLFIHIQIIIYYLLIYYCSINYALLFLVSWPCCSSFVITFCVWRCQHFVVRIWPDPKKAFTITLARTES